MDNSKEASVPDLAITYQGMVYPWHCDHMGPMNSMWYVGKFDEATRHLFASIGITPSYIGDNGRGVVAVEQRIADKRELLVGDMMTIWSGILEMKEMAIRFCREMQNEEIGEIAAIMVLTSLHIDRRIRKSIPLPVSVLERGRKMIVEYDPGI